MVDLGGLASTEELRYRSTVVIWQNKVTQIFYKLTSIVKLVLLRSYIIFVMIRHICIFSEFLVRHNTVTRPFLKNFHDRTQYCVLASTIVIWLDIIAASVGYSGNYT